jgi:hypothetical protein
VVAVQNHIPYGAHPFLYGFDFLRLCCRNDLTIATQLALGPAVDEKIQTAKGESRHQGNLNVDQQHAHEQYHSHYAGNQQLHGRSQKAHDQNRNLANAGQGFAAVVLQVVAVGLQQNAAVHFFAQVCAYGKHKARASPSQQQAQNGRYRGQRSKKARGSQQGGNAPPICNTLQSARRNRWQRCHIWLGQQGQEGQYGAHGKQLCSRAHHHQQQHHQHLPAAAWG